MDHSDHPMSLHPPEENTLNAEGCVIKAKYISGAQ